MTVDSPSVRKGVPFRTGQRARKDGEGGSPLCFSSCAAWKSCSGATPTPLYPLPSCQRSGLSSMIYNSHTGGMNEYFSNPIKNIYLYNKPRLNQSGGRQGDSTTYQDRPKRGVTPSPRQIRRLPRKQARVFSCGEMASRKRREKMRLEQPWMGSAAGGSRGASGKEAKVPWQDS